jgi:squalene synthase HpnC
VVSEVAPLPGAPELPPAYLVLGRAGSENFPVASRVLPRNVRADLMAVYGWARLVDELGDNYAGDRLAALGEAERQLRLALGGQPELGSHQGLHPLIAGVAELALRRGLPAKPLFDLLEANRQDQRVTRYETFDDLVGYCKLSANPVGRLVLGIFAAATPERIAWSDKICTALQLVEHWQDVAEDAVVGRIYLPQEDLRRFEVSEQELLPPPAPAGGMPQARPSRACRALMAFEVARARRLLDEGKPLVGSLRGQLRLAVAAFVAGGHAALDALAGTGFDIYAPTTHPAPRRFALQLAKLLAQPYRNAPRSLDLRELEANR